MNKGNNALKSVTWKNNDVCFNGEKNSSENLSTRTQFFFLKRESLCVCVCACACVFLCVCFLTAKRNFCECTCVLEQAAVAAISQCTCEGSEVDNTHSKQCVCLYIHLVSHCVVITAANQEVISSGAFVCVCVCKRERESVCV